MSQPKSRVSKVEVTRLIRAALDAGLKISEVRFGFDGSLTVVTVDETNSTAKRAEMTDSAAMRRIREMYSECSYQDEAIDEMSYVFTRSQRRAIEGLVQADEAKFIAKSHRFLTGVGVATLKDLVALKILEPGTDEYGDHAWRLSAEGRKIFEAQFIREKPRNP